MPSPDDTFFSLRRLHVVFGVSAMVLLGVTVWMMVADHRRPWKTYQRTFREVVSPWLTEAQLRQQKTDGYITQHRHLADAVATARRMVPSADSVSRFRQELARDAQQRGVSPPDFQRVQAAYDMLSLEPGAEAREVFLGRLNALVDGARVRRDDLDRRVRFRRAEFEQVRSEYEAQVGQGADTAKLARLQESVTRIKSNVESLAQQSQSAAAHHETLQDIVYLINRPVERAQRAVSDHRTGVDQLERLLIQQRPNAGKELLQWPLVDALGRPLAIEQVWLPELTIDYNFCRVARFDRCGTCHQAIDRPSAGRPAEPLIPGSRGLTVELLAPRQAPTAGQGTLEETYGFGLAGQGILRPNDATVGLVLPRTAAANAMLMAGDVILSIDDRPVPDRATAERLLLTDVAWGKPLYLGIQRGLPHPFASHPRLDLFLGAASPHPMNEFGCTICHEGQGSATDFAWASHTPNTPQQQADWYRAHGWFANAHWDHPMLPGRFAESRCLKCHHDVVDLEPSRRFPDPPAPKLLTGYNLVRQYGCFGCHEINGFDDSGRRVGPDMRLETAARRPGTMRKVGPSLVDAGARLDGKYFAQSITDPAQLRPATRMPRLFGMHEHLEGTTLRDAQRFEAVEVQGIIAYLASAGRRVEPAGTPSGVTESASAERGKRLFELRGCLACHKHREFPAGKSIEAADLSDLAAKYTSQAGKEWLTSWLRDPSRHSPRTKMPNLLLDPIPLRGSDANRRRMTDPAADIAAWLLTAGQGRGVGPQSRGGNSLPSPANGKEKEADVDELAIQLLRTSLPSDLAAEYLKLGVPAGVAEQAQPDAAILSAPVTLEKKLQYVGRRTIRRRGCFGCHETPGFADGPLIGPVLTDWGRKATSLLAFEQVRRFTAGPPSDDPDFQGFYSQALSDGRREGFLWQKLRMPRSFDYQKAQNKSYPEQLLMGRFALTDAEREAIITFVLGLVADPPAARYVHQPDRRGQAIVAGRRVLDQYACAQCHTLESDRWTIQFDPTKFPTPPASKDFDYVRPEVPARILAASKQTDRRGLGEVELSGMPRLNAQGQLLEDEDEDGNPIYAFTLWEPAAVNGQVWPIGGPDLLLNPSQIVGRREAWGGTLARLLYPVALREGQSAGASVTQGEAWGWLPPSLVHEGQAVRPAWVHQFLLAPRAIRPAALLRMPRYNLSSAEATALVDYFTAISNVEFPYATDAPDQRPIDGAGDPKQEGRQAGALRILTDRTTFCAKCHLIGDFNPGGENWTVLAPNLEQAGQRLRIDYLRRWLGSPRSVLPYTPMPVNFPPSGEPMGQDLLQGSSSEQLDAVAEFLVNYQGFMSRRTSVRQLMTSPTVVLPQGSRKE
jgi:cytochrome c551/c552